MGFPICLSLQFFIFTCNLIIKFAPKKKKKEIENPLFFSYQAPDGHIFLESFSPVYKHAHDFLIAISEVGLTHDIQ